MADFITKWLASISLGQYENNFKSNGFDDPVSVGELVDADLQQVRSRGN